MTEYLYAKFDYGSIIYDDTETQVTWITRTDLQAWVWAQPLHALETMFGAGWMGRICEIYEIARPSARHWHQLKKGTAEPPPACVAMTD